MRLPTKTTHKGYDFLDWTGAAYHPGVDYNWGPRSDSDLGQAVYPYKEGRVVWAESNGNGFGNQVILRHRDGSYSRYAHLHEITCEVNQWLNTFEQLGTVGNTGASKGPHLHFEIFNEYIWNLGPNFYPNGQTKEWVKKYYTDPNTIAPRVLKVKIIANRLDWNSWQGKLANINKMFEEGTANQLQFDFSIEHTDFDMTSVSWHFEGKNKRIDNNWLLRNVLNKAIGYDICVFVMDKSEWGGNTDGYAVGNELIDGIQTIVMHSKEFGTRRAAPEFEGRLAHEIGHSLHDMTKTHDNVHTFDYRTPTELFKSFYKLRFEDIKGWDIGGDRLFKWVDGKLKQKFVSYSKSAMYRSGINYWLEKGGYSKTF